MKGLLSEDSLRDLTEGLRKANEEFTRHYPGETGRRQPVHTVYGGAHLFKCGLSPAIGTVCACVLSMQYAPDFVVFARALICRASSELPERMLDCATDAVSEFERNHRAVSQGKQGGLVGPHDLHASEEKLRREPVEDFRIDFEDGYGNRPDAEEDGHAESAATGSCRRTCADGTLPPFIGIRIKPFNEELRARSMRTLDIFVSTVLNKRTASCRRISS